MTPCDDLRVVPRHTSSNTSTRSPLHAAVSSRVFSRWSFSRPGVATRMCGGDRRRSFASRFMLVPPTTTCTRAPPGENCRARATERRRAEKGAAAGARRR